MKSNYHIDGTPLVSILEDEDFKEKGTSGSASVSSSFTSSTFGGVNASVLHWRQRLDANSILHSQLGDFDGN